MRSIPIQAKARAIEKVGDKNDGTSAERIGYGKGNGGIFPGEAFEDGQGLPFLPSARSRAHPIQSNQVKVSKSKRSFSLINVGHGH